MILLALQVKNATIAKLNCDITELKKLNAIIIDESQKQVSKLINRYHFNEDFWYGEVIKAGWFGIKNRVPNLLLNQSKTRLLTSTLKKKKNV